ncbi:hypothetical protein SAMN02745202_00126 [Segatella oulorum]|uniref:Uncharacterized protein n=1 Tax=Segatella oulorum TaxID=28136 RepID=A0A1T4KN11_9BACT|nr:hypothetical protein SAMN02745202_00126 [Segatella oulorum]
MQPLFHLPFGKVAIDATSSMKEMSLYPYDMHKGRNFRRNYDPYHCKWMLNPIC